MREERELSAHANIMVQDLTCGRLMIPNVSIIDMNMNVRTVTLDQEHY
jgi:hypothetical protein